jgi:hypothetical protein
LNICEHNSGSVERFRIAIDAIAILCFLIALSGCAGRHRPTIAFPPPPAYVISAQPTGEEIAAAVNRSASIRQLSTNSANVSVLTMPSLPKLKATVHAQRDRSFRLRANLPIMVGSGLDMGSNDEMFWFEVPEGVSKVLYYARHDAYQQQLQKSILPVDPTWMMDALGLLQIDPTQIIAGPVRRPDGKLEIRSNVPMPDGMYNRVCYIDANGAYVTDQLLFNPTGQLIAASEATNHVFYPNPQSDPVATPTGNDGVVLPHLVKVSLAPQGGEPLSMQIEIASYTINQLLTSDPNLFVAPQNANARDLTTIGPGPIAAQPSAYSASVSTANPLR